MDSDGKNKLVVVFLLRSIFGVFDCNVHIVNKERLYDVGFFCTPCTVILVT